MRHLEAQLDGHAIVGEDFGHGVRTRVFETAYIVVAKYTCRCSGSLAGAGASFGGYGRRERLGCACGGGVR